MADNVGRGGETVHHCVSKVSVALGCTHRIHFFGVVDDRGACGLVCIESLLVGSIHSIAAKAYSRKPDRPSYAAPCMSIRPELQAAASPSDGSTDLTGSEGKHLRG